MGWLIVFAVIALILYIINGNGKRRWRLSIAQVVSGMFPDSIAKIMRQVLEQYGGELTATYLRVIANYVVAMSKGEQGLDAMHRDSRNVLCIIHGDSQLKHLLYDKYCEVMELWDEDKRNEAISYDEFSSVLADIRCK